MVCHKKILPSQKKTNMNNEIVLNPQIRDFLFSHCDKAILSPSFEWLKIVETKYSNYWNATDFLHTDIEGLELVDKVQLVCLFILHGKVEIDSPIHDFKIPQDVWVYMLEHKYIKPNEHRFLFMNWNPDGFVTCANL